MTATAVTIRPARPGDDRELVALDDETWSPRVSPSPRWSLERRFFGDGTRIEDVIVAAVPTADGEQVVGYVKVGESVPLASNAHVLHIWGLAVLPERQGRGIGRELIRAAEEAARIRGARKLTLRVLGTNPGAQSVYATAGFVVEGVLREEFLIDDQYVDDVLMAKYLTG